jgi:CRISPR/Cas system CMR-associated protein Cmr5 small subunit
MKTRAQVWSRFAFERVSPGSPLSDTTRRDAAKYKTSCHRMPGLVHQCGALQALVFMVARDDTGAIYVEHLAQTYRQDRSATAAKLVADVQAMDMRSYMAFTGDLAEIATWFRRFAQIELASVEASDGR